MKSLIWKQWRESKVYLIIYLCWMILAAIYCVAYELSHRYYAAIGHFNGLASSFTMCAALFLAMRTAQGEQTAGTLSFTAALPISLRRVALVRIAGAIAALSIPLLVAAGMLAIALTTGLIEQAVPRDTENYIQLSLRAVAPLSTALEQLASVTAINLLGGMELLLLLCLLGCLLRSQAHVGFLGALISLGFMIAQGIFWYGPRQPAAQLIYGSLFPHSLSINWGYGAEDGSFADHELAKYRWLALGLSIPLLTFLGYLFTLLYGRLRRGTSAEAGRYRLRIPPLWSYLPLRLTNRWSALIWLEARQSWPLAIWGLLLAMLIAVVSSKIDSHSSDPALLAELPHTVAFVGMLWAVVVGSAIYSAELRPGLGGFWRSRPISAGMWFCCKYFVGLTAVLIVLDAVTILMNWNAPRDHESGVSWTYLGCFPIIHAFMYALAVLGTCWLRKPVIGGILAILGYAVLTIAIESFISNNYEPIHIYNMLLQTELQGQVDFTQHGYPQVYGTLVALFALSSVVSFQLARPLERENRLVALFAE